MKSREATIGFVGRDILASQLWRPEIQIGIATSLQERVILEMLEKSSTSIRQVFDAAELQDF